MISLSNTEVFKRRLCHLRMFLASLIAILYLLHAFPCTIRNVPRGRKSRYHHRSKSKNVLWGHGNKNHPNKLLV